MMDKTVQPPPRSLMISEEGIQVEPSPKPMPPRGQGEQQRPVEFNRPKDRQQQLGNTRDQGQPKTRESLEEAQLLRQVFDIWNNTPTSKLNPKKYLEICSSFILYFEWGVEIPNEHLELVQKAIEDEP